VRKVEKTETSIKNLETRFKQPDHMEWGNLQRSDYGIRYAKLPAVGEAKGTVLIAQGFSEFIEKYFELMRDFSNSGYNVIAFDWRCQGKSGTFVGVPHDLAVTQNFDAHIADLKALTDHVLTNAAPNYLVAHSMGGHLSARFLHDYPAVFDAAVLSAPMMRLKLPYADWIMRVLLWGVKTFSNELTPAEKKGGWSDKNGPIERDPRTKDPLRRVVQYTYCLDDAELRLGPPTYQWARHALNSTSKIHNAKYYSEIVTPVLIGVAEDEKIVMNEAIEFAANNMPNAKIYKAKGAEHEIFMERDEIRGLFMREILSFLEKYR
jgi:lysophospholipase